MTTVAKGFTSVLGKLLTAGSETVNGADGRSDVEETARLLASVVVNHYTGGLLGDVSRPGCSTTLLRVADHMSERHNILFSRYGISCNNEYIFYIYCFTFCVIWCV